MPNERGPVGGAGELTAALEATLSYLETLVLEHSPDCSYESTDSPRGDFCDCDLKARKVKRSQIYMQLQAAAIVEFNAKLAAKAPQGVPSREQFEQGLYASDEPLTHKAIMRVFDAAAGDRPAPPAPSKLREKIEALIYEWERNRPANIARPFYRELREALAAAPPPPTWVCGNGDHACNLRGYCVNPNCDRHASAELVRELIAKIQKWRDEGWMKETTSETIIRKRAYDRVLGAVLALLPPSTGEKVSGATSPAKDGDAPCQS